jgi:hypothetical protein
MTTVIIILGIIAYLAAGVGVLLVCIHTINYGNYSDDPPGAVVILLWPIAAIAVSVVKTNNAIQNKVKEYRSKIDAEKNHDQEQVS